MQTKFTAAINQICDEKNLSRDVVMETVKAALASAYKKDYGSKNQEVRVEIEEESGAIQVYVSKEVVEEVEDPMTQIETVKADRVKKGAKVGDMVEILDVPADFGRIAAQTAKQVIIQRIREAERDMIFDEFKDKEGELVNAVVQRVEGDTVIADLGKATGIMYRSEQMAGEHYYPGQRMKVFVLRVESSSRGPQIVISRSHPEMVKKLFEMEVPEILAGTIEIKAIAREGGERTKIAVATDQESIDPVGALVGQRGSRVQSVMSEIGDEKIDIILWDPDIKTYIKNALSPAKVIDIDADEKEKKAVVKVPEDQLSLAIGKKGQNVRLAAKLTGWNVDIAGADESGVETIEKAAAPEAKKAGDIEDAIIQNIQSQKGEEGEKEEAKEAEPADAAPAADEAGTAEDIASEDELAAEIIGEQEETGEAPQAAETTGEAEDNKEAEKPSEEETPEDAVSAPKETATVSEGEVEGKKTE